MSKEKLLWTVCIGLAVLSAVLGVLLFQAVAGGSKGNSNADPTPPSSSISQPGPGTANGEEEPKRPVAQAGDIALEEDAFLEGLKEMYGAEYVNHWLKRTVVQLEAQALGISISRSDIDDELERMQIGYDSPEEYFRVMREQLGLTEETLRNDALYRLMLEGIATYHIEVTDADVERYIEENPEEFAPVHEIRYAQIATATEEQSMRVLEQLENGVDFGLLAKDVSIDSATSADGGDSGWVAADDPFIAEEIALALEQMNVGDVEGPLKLSDHWVIVTLLGRRTIDPLDDSSVKETLRREIALSQAPSLFEVEAYLLKKYNAVDFLGQDW